MPPRLSQNVEAARAAAAQAEFNEKKWVWVPDEKEGYLAGWVNTEEGDVGEIIMAAGGDFRRVPLYALSKMNPPKFDRVEDIADLTFLNEASVVHNLRLRYGSGSIYTYSGLFLVAINPYQSLPLYSDAIVHQYRGKRKDESPPHIFAVAERAWVNMGEERENQSILITGESGAGKTESTKKVIQYLAAIATDVHAPASPSLSRSPTGSGFGTTSITGLPRSNSFKRGHIASPSIASSLTAKGRLGLLERQILQANPILEAFGNAQTQRNNNSSRFGKFVRITFAPDGSIAGANIDWYLLEKSRVVVRSEAERSFHVFYQLLVGGGALKDKLLLDGGIEDYEYLNKSRREVDGVNDIHEWSQLKAGLDVVGFSEAEQFDLFRIVAAVLHIGNIVITSTRSDDAVMPDPSQAERVCHLLGIPIAEFTRAVLRPRVLAGREWVTQARTQRQALDELASLCKTLYEKSFGSIVDRINQALDRPSSKSTFIGVLDIAGFEIFEINTYEQLLINYTNEKLQQFFNHHMFVLEQEEYTREGIKWDYVNFGLDLQPTIDLIESTGLSIGILSCLDEECIMPKATDKTFTSKLHHFWGVSIGGVDEHPGKTKYEPARFDQGFLIQHYAAKVEYRTDGWLEKNKDPLNDNVTRVLAASSDKYVAALFSDYAEPPPGPGGAGNMFTLSKKRGMKKGAFRTVGQRHKEQLSSLMSQLQATQPHFVRCIVPNNHKKPGRVDVPLVLDQLRCNGVLEGIRIARLGYPNRLPFVEFRQRYEVVTPGIIPPGYMDGREACRRMVKTLELDDSIFKIGTSKIFFKAGVLAELEERRDLLLFDIFSRLQAVARMWTARRQIKKVLNRAIAIRTIQRNARIYGELRDWPWWKLYTKVRPLLAATRNDEELRQKDMELVLIKERAERDKLEKEKLETLKMSLEAEKRKIDEELAAERALAVDKDTLLERSKNRELELEEELSDLQADAELLDSQLARAMELQKKNEENNAELRQQLDQAAEYLMRLEGEQKIWAGKETDLSNNLTTAQEEIDTLRRDILALEKASEDLKALREQDLARARDRSEVVVKELQGKLDIEIKTKEILQTQADAHEAEARHTKEQLAELARTTNEYSNMLAKKEERIAHLLEQMENGKRLLTDASQEIGALRGDIDTLAAELEAEQENGQRSTAARAKLQEELDELRTSMAAKTSEHARRLEAEKSLEIELGDLRSQTALLQQELADARRVALENQGRLKLELSTANYELNSLRESQKALTTREHDAQAKLVELRASVSELEKSKRSLESELQSVRTRQHEHEAQLAEARKAKESLERQLAATQAKYHKMEDLMLELEREKTNQFETSKKQLEAESSRRAKFEQRVASQKAELALAKDRNIKLERDFNKAMKDLKEREWEVKQLESRQDKTIVEHVHVLEEAKRVTDRQLADAQLELQKQSAYIRSLENVKSRLTNDIEDLARENEVGVRTRDKAVRAEEEKAAKALAEAEKARKAKDIAEDETRRLQIDFQNARRQAEEALQELGLVRRSKNNLESELERLAHETHAPVSMAKVQRQYESRISQLEEQLNDATSSRELAAKIRQRVDQHHDELRKLVMNSGRPLDSSFQSRLLEELKRADEDLEREMSMRLRHPNSDSAADVQSMANVSPKKGNSRHRDSFLDRSSSPDRQVAVLKQQVHVLELQMIASERVRQHLEASIREMTTDLENSDGSKQSLQSYRSRLAKENARLAELLQEEVEARRAAEAAQIDGVQAMWSKFQNSIDAERQNYARLEESRKALLVQQRTSQAEMENQKAQVRELTDVKKRMQAEADDLRAQLSSAKTETASVRRQLQKRLQDDDLSSSTSSVAQSEMRAVIESYKAKEQANQERFEQAEIERAKAARAEAFVRRSLSDLEKTHADTVAQHKALQDRLKASETRLKELQGRMDDDSSSDLIVINQRLVEELDDEKARHQKDIQQGDFAADQTRKKYQAELAQLSEELQSQRDSMSRLREENRKLRSDYDELQLTFDDEVYNSGGWKKEKERMETKIADVTKAYEASSGAQAEQQAQIVALHGQARQLRAMLDDVESDRVLLHKARRSLQIQLDDIRSDQTDRSKLSTDREFQRLQLEKQDLQRSLEEQGDRVAQAHERMKKAEGLANDFQMKLSKSRVDYSELERLNASLEKQVKELNVRMVDLETKAYANSSRPPTISRNTRVEELTNKLQHASNKSEASKLLRDANFQQAEVERHRVKFEQERSGYESEIQHLRHQMDIMATQESEMQAAKRRAERDAADYKQKALSLQHELERMRNRLDRPSSSIGSPHSSPRK